MGAFLDNRDAQRFEQTFAGADGESGAVFADYAAQGSTRILLHVEADPALRGSGAAGQFMQALAEHARAEGLKLTPRCGYAVAWLKRHPEFDDLKA